MKTTITHQDISIEVEYDADEGQKGDYWNPPIPYSLEVCEFKIEDTLDNMEVVFDELRVATKEGFEFCWGFVDDFGRDVLVVDYCGLLLEIISESDEIIYSYEVLDIDENWKIVHGLLEEQLTKIQ